MSIDQGYYFGEVDLLFGETRKHSYMAKTDCELLSLSKKNFTKIFFHDFREIGAEIYNNALKRRVRAQKTYKEALQYCQQEAKSAKKSRRPSKKFVAQTSTVTRANFQLKARDLSRSFFIGNKDILGLQSQATETFETQATTINENLPTSVESKDHLQEETKDDREEPKRSRRDSLDKETESTKMDPSVEQPSSVQINSLLLSHIKNPSDPIHKKLKELDDQYDSSSNASNENAVKSDSRPEQVKTNEKRSAWSRFKSMFGQKPPEEEEKNELERNTEQNKKMSTLSKLTKDLVSENNEKADEEIDIKNNKFAKLLTGEVQLEQFEEEETSPAQKSGPKKTNDKWNVLKNSLNTKSRLDNGIKFNDGFLKL